MPDNVIPLPVPDPPPERGSPLACFAAAARVAEHDQAALRAAMALPEPARTRRCVAIENLSFRRALRRLRRRGRAA